MHEREIRARVNEIEAELARLGAELRQLRSYLNNGDDHGNGEPRRRHLWPVPDGTAAMIATLGTAVKLPLHRPRHPLGVAAATAILGAVAAILPVPAHTARSGPGYAISQPPPALKIPGHGHRPAPTHTTSTPGPHATPTGPGTVASTAPTAPSSIPAPPPPTGQPTPAPPTPTGTPPPTTPGPTPTHTANCFLKITLTGVIEVCVG